MIKSTFAVLAAGASMALSLGLAGPALADNQQYYVPVCTGNDIPMNSACRMGGPQGTPTISSQYEGTGSIVGGPADQLPAVSPGANPYIPVGVGN
jgi:hypothetical protein